MAEVTKEAVQSYKLFIDGEFIDSASGRTFTSVNPASGEPLAEVAEAEAQDADRAVLAARAAFDSWRKTPAIERGKLLRKIGQAILDRGDELARLETQDCGKPIRETAGADIPFTASTFEYWGSVADKLEGRVIPVQGDFLNYVVREPIGVVGLIIPWNYPLLMAAWKLAPALACGNTAILKPAEQTPVTAMELAKICAEVGLPDGVVNILPGYGPTAGAAITAHPKVDKIAFTGEWRTAQEIVKASAGNLKRLSFELGGKSPMIVFPDADLNQAVRSGLFGIYYCQGENCDATSRILVHESLYEQYTSKFVERCKKLVLGDPLDETTDLGAIISAEQLERIAKYSGLGVKEGAKLLCGGSSVTPRGLEKGWFFAPTAFGDVRNDMRIAQEEIFGPVVSILKFKTEEEAIQLANDVMYGLAASIWTQDIKRAHRVAAEIRAGSVEINTCLQISPASPFGGYKMSGYGREGGPNTIDLYTEIKSVWVDLSRDEFDWYKH
ncbi:MAG: aldehyde dehydrogenase family protein [Candidatus Acidiferrales bacterium]